MSQAERFEILVLGSGAGGKFVAWHMARAGRRTAVVERQWIRGSCPNINCPPSKNEIWSAKVASLVRRGAEFGAKTGRVAIDMATVRDRKRSMVDHQIAAHLRNYKESGTELIMGSGRFVAPKTLEVQLNDGGTPLPIGDRCSLTSVPTRPFQPCPGSRPLDLSRTSRRSNSAHVPPDLILVGGGYVGLEFAKAYRRFGSRVTIIERDPQLMAREDPDVSEELQCILSGEGIHFLVGAEIVRVDGRSGTKVSLVVRTSSSEQEVAGSDVLVAAGRIPNIADATPASTRPESSWTLRASFVSTSGWRPVHPTSGPSANARGARSSRTCRNTVYGCGGARNVAAATFRLGACQRRDRRRQFCRPERL